jgi:hypothetical protein
LAGLGKGSKVEEVKELGAGWVRVRGEGEKGLAEVDIPEDCIK